MIEGQSFWTVEIRQEIQSLEFRININVASIIKLARGSVVWIIQLDNGRFQLVILHHRL